jgi:hypothetical protein
MASSRRVTPDLSSGTSHFNQDERNIPLTERSGQPRNASPGRNAAWRQTAWRMRAIL